MITRTCRVSGKKFTITADDLDFYRKMEIISAEDYEKLKSSSFAKASDDERAEIVKNCVGLPTLCPEERQRRRLAWRNERKLYARKCDLCEKSIISIYDKNAEFPVYCQDCWWSDKWDAKKFSRDFDFSRPFFEQFHELERSVPHIALHVLGNENSDYVNACGYAKNCYLSFQCDFAESCLYCNSSSHSVSCTDCLIVNKSELCYEGINLDHCYNCLYSQNSKNCFDSYFIKSCIGCNNCFGCVNLRNKSYYFMNKPYSKEEYKKHVAEFLAKNSLANLRTNFQKFLAKFPQKYAEIKNCEDCSGDNLSNSKNARDCYDCFQVEDCRFCADFETSNDCYDYNFGGYDSELCCEIGSGGKNCYNVRFSINIWGNVRDSEYISVGRSLSNCFGCAGLRDSKYCILNKQYTKEEYEKTREKIIEHMKNSPLVPLNEGEGARSASGGVEWGEFFPIELSPFAYNETVAQEYFPLNPNPLTPLSGGTNQQVFHQNPNLNFKYKWKDKISRDFRPATIESIPDDIKDVDDSICREILACNNPLNPPCQGEDNSCSSQKCGKNYQIQKPELRFYRKMNLPIPRKCPDCRHADRMKLRNPRTLFERSCSDCEKDIQTTFAPDRPEKVLCEECYLKII